MMFFYEVFLLGLANRFRLLLGKQPVIAQEPAHPGLDRDMKIAGVAIKMTETPGRVRHLFVEQTGLPFRTYLLWLRITKAVGMFAAGASLTQAAHEAGFAGSAHFSRTFRKYFGFVPSAIHRAQHTGSPDVSS